MSMLNWGVIQDGGTFESLLHAILFAEDAGAILFGRPGKDAGQDARSSDGTTVYQAKYREGLTMDRLVRLAIDELAKIKKYREEGDYNHRHWQNVNQWILAANISINPNDATKWLEEVVPQFGKEGLTAKYWDLQVLERKLESYPQIRDAFFGGENRTLVGLKEAYELLSNESIATSLESPMFGREVEKQTILNFAASDDKRVLPVVGPGGIGKSRLLFECLVELAADGWRVYWALPGTMARSSRWFHQMNGKQPTCVVIDDPDDPGLLRAVLEQLATGERDNWKIIVASRPERGEALLPFLINKLVSEPLRLSPLEESDSKELLRSRLKRSHDDSWLHTVHNYARGVPGWLCLIAELYNQDALPNLSTNVDLIAGQYVKSCLNSLEEAHRSRARTLLRWLSLWSTLTLDHENDQLELRYIETLGISTEEVRGLLDKLVEAGLVRNWGARKRLFAVEPLIIREYLLSSWLLEESEGIYRVSSEGKKLVASLVHGKVPAIERVLSTLSHLTWPRLDVADRHSLLRPIFVSIQTMAKEGSIIDQYRAVNLVEKIGNADPESALDVLSAVRLNNKEEMTVDVSPWGTETFAWPSILSMLPWVLFQITEHVSDITVARRCLIEFRELFTLEESSAIFPERGKQVRELIERLLCRSKQAFVFAQPAREIIESELTTPASSSFAELLLRSELNPERELVEWTATWTMTITRRAIAPDSQEWNCALELRGKVFEALKIHADVEARCRLWQVLAGSHHQFHYMIMHGPIKGQAASYYRAVLINDLEECAVILNAQSNAITIEEATHARGMWSWYLEYGSDLDPVDQARDCEAIYRKVSTWRLHDFFKFAPEEQLEPETERIVAILMGGDGSETYAKFFDEAERYLAAKRHHGLDTMDFHRIAKIADRLWSKFDPTESAPTSPVTSFIMSILDQENDKSQLAWHFAITVCQNYLGAIKRSNDSVAASDAIHRLLELARDKRRLLFSLYSNIQPAITGPLTKAELEWVLEYKDAFSVGDLFTLLGIFAIVDWDSVRAHLDTYFEHGEHSSDDVSRLMERFIRSLYFSTLRYETQPNQIPIAWIIESIAKFNLDGSLLSMYELDTLRDRADFKLTITQFADLVSSRINVGASSKESSSSQAMPHDFRIGDWCKFDANNPEDIAGFVKLCLLALDPNFISIYWVPKYVAQLDPSGVIVGSFVKNHMQQSGLHDSKMIIRLGYLASAYPDSSQAWAEIARPICERALGMTRDDRERIYFALSRKETGVISSNPGVVPEYYVRVRDDANAMLESEPIDSPLRDYRKWSLQNAEADLRREQEQVEEDFND